MFGNAKAKLGVLLPIVALAGCSGSGGAAPDTLPKPGNWKHGVTLLSFSSDDAPDVTKRLMQDRYGVEESHEACTSEEDASAGIGAFVVATQQGDCTMEDAKAEGGKVSGTLVCPPNARLAVTGTYSEGRFELSLRGPYNELSSPSGKSTVEMKVVSVRTGDCS